MIARTPRLGIVLVTAILLGCGWSAPSRARTLADVAFMSGCWRGQLPQGGGWIEERYSPPAAGMMLGTSHTVGGQNTKYYEFIEITEREGEVEMTPLPAGKKSVSFRLVRLLGKKAVFENAEHDFPKRIIYQLKDDGMLLARIEGDKPEQAQEFPMKPVSCSGTNLANVSLTWGDPGADIGQYHNPSGIAIYRDGNGVDSLVLTDTNNHRLRAFTANGMFIEKWGEQGAENGQFYYPQGVAVNSKGEVIIADAGNHRIEVTLGPPPDMMHLPGSFVRAFGHDGTGDGELHNPLAVAVDAADNIYVIDTDNNRVQKFDPQGRFLTKWGRAGRGDGEFNIPSGIAVDRKGTVYVVDTDNNRIQKFTADGKFLAAWGQSGSREGEFYRPKGIAADRDGNLYVADCNNHRIEKFSPEGKFLGAFGRAGREAGELSFPNAVAVDDFGHIYVADSKNDRIQVFQENKAVADLYVAAK
jgi:DNA-binding beta-propeller fold protein YncE